MELILHYFDILQQRRIPGEYKYTQQFGRQSMPMAYYPSLDYTRPPPTKSSPREYPRLTAPPPQTRYQDYPPSPRAYYPPRY